MSSGVLLLFSQLLGVIGSNLASFVCLKFGPLYAVGLFELLLLIAFLDGFLLKENLLRSNKNVNLETRSSGV